MKPTMRFGRAQRAPLDEIGFKTQPGERRGGRTNIRGRADYADAMVASINRLGGRFTMAALYEDLKVHCPPKDYSRWHQGMYIASQVAHWRETDLLTLVPDTAPRTFQTTARWKE